MVQYYVPTELTQGLPCLQMDLGQVCGLLQINTAHLDDERPLVPFLPWFFCSIGLLALPRSIVSVQRIIPALSLSMVLLANFGRIEHSHHRFGNVLFLNI